MERESDDGDVDTTASNASDDSERPAVLVVGGGVAGLTAAVFTARAGFDTLVVNHGESILRRNAHLENFPGFPAGVDPRLFVDMLEAQATRNGAEVLEGQVTSLSRTDDGFAATVDDEDELVADFVVAASWSDAEYLTGVNAETRAAGSKTYVGEDGLGRTNVEGLYVAGRLAERYHQTIVAAGHGAQTAITLVHDSDVPFYHDWVAPEGYFTDRGRDVPPGCEEIDAAEQAARQEESRETMHEYFSEPHPARQRTHPSLVDDELGRVPEEEW